jgi:CxxC motif-containing protein (DUF1111 family)
MKIFKVFFIVFFAAFTLPIFFIKSAHGDNAEAPTGFDNQTNGFISQADFDSTKAVFEERDDIAKGLGPVYNAQSCAECHQNPVTGGISQITELRAGHFDGTNFIDHPGGSLINDRAINGSIQERVLAGNEVRTFRTSLNILGDGFVECIADSTFQAIQNSQPFGMKGTIISVPVLEFPGTTRIGRFGWKNQQASLLSFASDAYLNEQGITNRFNLVENTSNGRSVAAFDTVADTAPNGEDPDGDIFEFADFMRATKAPSRDTTLAVTADAQAGAQLFNAIGCAICHVANISTAPAGTVLTVGDKLNNDGTVSKLTVPSALGSKTFHPYGDFMLHDIGTGDGIVQNGGQATRNKLRTAPLWGMRTRDRLMHDGLSVTRTDAILRHLGEASGVTFNFILLSDVQKNQLITFLNSL